MSELTLIVEFLGQSEQRSLVHHRVTDITEGRLTEPVLCLFGIHLIVDDQVAIITGDGVVARFGRHVLKPAVTEIRRLLIAFLGQQFQDALHHVVLTVMVDDIIERITIGRLLLIVAFAHRTDLCVVAQFTIDVHLSHIIVRQSEGIELCLVDLTEKGQCLVVETGSRTLESRPGDDITNLCWLVHLTGKCLCAVQIGQC